MWQPGSGSGIPALADMKISADSIRYDSSSHSLLGDCVDRVKDFRPIFRKYIDSDDDDATVERPDRLDGYKGKTRVNIWKNGMQITSLRPFYPMPRLSWYQRIAEEMLRWVVDGQRG
jgi:hypothetical protein